MRLKGIGLFLVIPFGIMTFQNEAVSEQRREVVGEVMAIDTEAEPQTIVVRTTTAAGKRLIVGCRLDADTVIKNDNRPATLDEFQAGDSVRLTYLRVEDGLVARLIEKR